MTFTRAHGKSSGIPGLFPHLPGRLSLLTEWLADGLPVYLDFELVTEGIITEITLDERHLSDEAITAMVGDIQSPEGRRVHIVVFTTTKAYNASMKGR